MILNNALLLVLLVLAVAAGWTLGRGGLRMDGAERAQLPSQYYRGFNFLLDGEEDDAVDAFTEALAVNEDTLDTHIALGSVLRKRGEVDRAIRIHQNLLKRPQLTAVQLHQSHLELARDFIAAGLYDRAEQLLSDLAVQSTEFSATAQRHLLDVHEAQRDWVAATAIADQLIAQAGEGGQSATGQGQPAQQLRGHYLCEQGDTALESGDVTTAGAFYEDALRDQDQDLRARMSLAKLRLSAGDPEAALAHFRVIMGSGRNCTPELLALLSDICAAKDDGSQYLAALEEHDPDILGMSALVTTTMPYMKVVIDTLTEQGIRDNYIVLVGGAPLNEEFSKAIGADSYCRDAAVAVETAKQLIAARKHNQVVS